MKNLVIIMMFFSHILCQSQTNEERNDSIQSEIVAPDMPIKSKPINTQRREWIESEVINRIQKINPMDLTPFYASEVKKWGILHRKSKKEIVPAIFKDLAIFNPGLNLWNFNIVKTRKGYQIVDLPVWYAVPPEMALPPDIYDPAKYYKDIPGFEVDENGIVTAINKKYAMPGRNNKFAFLISDVFNFNGTFYAIWKVKDKQFCIIDQHGTIIKGLENSKIYPRKYQVYTDDDVWFLGMFDNSFKYTLRSLKSGITLPFEFDDFRCWGCNVRFGYQEFFVNGKWGLFDMALKKWHFPPNSEQRFGSYLVYSSLVEINIPNSIKEVLHNRKQVMLYRVSVNNVLQDMKGNWYEVEKTTKAHDR